MEYWAMLNKDEKKVLLYSSCTNISNHFILQCYKQIEHNVAVSTAQLEMLLYLDLHVDSSDYGLDRLVPGHRQAIVKQLMGQ